MKGIEQRTLMSSGLAIATAALSLSGCGVMASATSERPVVTPGNNTLPVAESAVDRRQRQINNESRDDYKQSIERKLQQLPGDDGRIVYIAQLACL